MEIDQALRGLAGGGAIAAEMQPNCLSPQIGQRDGRSVVPLLHRSDLRSRFAERLGHLLRTQVDHAEVQSGLFVGDRDGEVHRFGGCVDGPGVSPFGAPAMEGELVLARREQNVEIMGRRMGAISHQVLSRSQTRTDVGAGMLQGHAHGGQTGAVDGPMHAAERLQRDRHGLVGVFSPDLLDRPDSLLGMQDIDDALAEHRAEERDRLQGDLAIRIGFPRSRHPKGPAFGGSVTEWRLLIFRQRSTGLRARHGTSIDIDKPQQDSIVLIERLDRGGCTWLRFGSLRSWNRRRRTRLGESDAE